MKIQNNQFFQPLKGFGLKENSYLLQAMLFCILFACAIAINPDLKNGMIAGKQFFFIFIAGAITILSFFRLRKYKENSKYNVTRTDIFVFTYVLYILTKVWIDKAVILTDLGVLELVLVTVVYAHTKPFFNQNKKVKQSTIILVFLGFGLYQGVYGLGQLYGLEMSHHASFKVTGTFFNPAPFSGYLASVFPISLAFYLFTAKKDILNRVLKYLGLITSLVILFIIPFAQSRASWLALIIGTLIVSSQYFQFRSFIVNYLKTKGRRIGLLFIILAIVTSSGIGLFYWKKILFWGVF